MQILVHKKSEQPGVQQFTSLVDTAVYTRYIAWPPSTLSLRRHCKIKQSSLMLGMSLATSIAVHMAYVYLLLAMPEQRC